MKDRQTESADNVPAAGTSQCIHWYREGESRTVEVSGIQVTVRFVGRKGRRARIKISAPAGAVFRDDSHAADVPSSVESVA